MTKKRTRPKTKLVTVAAPDVDLHLLRHQSNRLAEIAQYLTDRAELPAWTEAIEGVQNLLAHLLRDRSPVTSIESQVYIDGGDEALADYRQDQAQGTRTLYVVYREDGAVEQDTTLLHAYWTEPEAEAAVKGYEDSALEGDEDDKPERVHGREEDWEDEDADEADWTVCFGYAKVEIPWPPPEWAELFAGIVRVNRLLDEALNLLPAEPEEEPEMVRHTACRHCGQDIEGIRPAPGAPYPAGEWRDRGNNSTCPNEAGDAGQVHEPEPGV